MEYKGVSVEDMHKLWKEKEQKIEDKKTAGRQWDKTYRDAHREERNQKAREYYRRKKEATVRLPVGVIETPENIKD